MNHFLKSTREESDAHMLAWLQGTGMVVGHWGTGFPADIESLAPEGVDLHRYYTDPAVVAQREDTRLRSKLYPLDMLPIAMPDINTLPIALYLGAQPQFTRSNIWYNHTDLSPENDRPLLFDPLNEWYQNHTALLQACRERANGAYYVGMPAMVPNLDVLVELRGAQQLLMDLVLSPEWVHHKLQEINDAALKASSGMAALCTDEKGWMTYGYFMFRGPGKIALAHCDTAAMISEDMFREFVVPYVAQHCQFHNYTLYHVDGPAALRSVDALLEIDNLSALQFTPGPQVPQGGNKQWFDLYRKIKQAGKSVMAVWIAPEEIEPLLDAVGPQGMYLMVDIVHERQIEQTQRIIERFR